MYDDEMEERREEAEELLESELQYESEIANIGEACLRTCIFTTA